MKLALGIVLGTLTPTLALAQTSPARQIDVDEAVRLAIASSPGLAAAHLHKDATVSSARSLRGHLLPAIQVSDEQQHYTDPFAIAFGPQTIVARNINTNTFVAGAGQPLLGLLHLTQDHAALSASAEAAEEQAASIESSLREQVRTGFLRYFEARAMVDIAKASEAQLAEQHQVADARLKAGVLTQADLLRVDVAEANARLQEIQAASQAQIARSALLVALGFEPGTNDVAFVEPTQLEAVGAPSDGEAAAQKSAVVKRHEVLQAHNQAEAARHQAKARFFELLPEVNLEAAYIHIEGQILAPKDSAYLGLKASWPIWQWGADYYAYKAADQSADAARALEADQAERVRIDASSKLAQAQASSTAVDLAQATIASAEEAFRVTDAQVKAGSATTTDLLDSQSALTTAKLNLVRAKYERAIARVALARATGG